MNDKVAQNTAGIPNRWLIKLINKNNIRLTD